MNINMGTSMIQNDKIHIIPFVELSYDSTLNSLLTYAYEESGQKYPTSIF